MAQTLAAALGTGFSFLVIVTLALVTPRPERDRVDAASGRPVTLGQAASNGAREEC